jgi:tubulin polyglutamylase TTLL9
MISPLIKLKTKIRWLIEINASPALTASSQDDFELKFRLLDDTLTIIDMENRLTGKEKRVGGFDMIWNDGPVYVDDCSADQPKLNSFLGK